MNLIRRTLSTALLGLTSLAAMAAPQQYTTGVQNIRAGVVILDSGRTNTQAFGRSAAPFAFYNLNNALGVKPVSWNLLNPHAPSVVTTSTLQRWTEILGVGASDLPVVGAPITKRNAEYWSVFLDQTSDANISDYDVLLLNPTNGAPISLNASERERLTKFVDQGGILWIDPGAVVPPLDDNNSFPLSFNLFSIPGTPNAFANTFSPLLTTPYVLTGQDLNTVSGNEAVPFLGLKAATTVPAYDLVDPAQFLQYLGITFVGAGETISVAHIGDGEIVVTTQGASQILNRSSGTGPFSNPNGLPINNSYTAVVPNLETDGISAAKLAVNIISQIQSFPQAGGGARKTGGSAIDVTAPVLANWTQENGTSSTTPTPAPVVYKGVTVASEGNSIVVYSSNPGADLDKDGDPDDGIIDPASGVVNNALRDTSIGKPYDIIWTSTPMTGPLSSPVCAEVPDGAFGVTDVVMVVDNTGTLFVYDLFKKNANGQLYGGTRGSLYSVPIPASTLGFGIVDNFPNAPTVSGDLAFLADNTSGGALAQGRLWVVDLSTGAPLADTASSGTDWRVGGGNTGVYVPPAYTSSPTVGYIPIQDGSGGYDKVVYAPGVTGANEAPCFNSIWFGTKDESPSYSEAGGTLTIATRLMVGTAPTATPSGMAIYAPGGGSPAQQALAPRITFLDVNGQPLNGIMTGSPTFNSPLPGEITANVNDADFNGAGQRVFGVRVDYTIDWGLDPDTLSATEERGKLIFPMPPLVALTPMNRRILGPIAMSPAGTLCMTVADPIVGDNDNEGSLWWVRENKGRGGFQVAGRWALYPSHSIPSTPSPTPSVAVFDDQDPLTAQIGATAPGLGAIMSAPMVKWHWSGGPVIQGNQVIATATAMKGLFVPVTVVMAFAAEPPTPQFQASNFTTGFSLVQPDFDKTSPGQVATPDQTSTIQSANYEYDSTSGTVQLTNLANISGNVISDALSLSQPVIVRGGAGDVVFQPENSGGAWSPLHWYCIFNGSLAQGRPLVTGNTVFFAANSLLPSILSGNFSTLLKFNAVLNAMTATISAGSQYTIPSTARPFETQVGQTNAAAIPNPDIKMPSGSGISSFSDYQTRVVQQTLGESTQAFGVVGGGTNLAAWGNSGIYGLSRGDFVVCDQGRVIRSDSSGNITFASNANVNTGPGGGSTIGNVTGLVRPTRAYPLSTSEMLIVDPGSNRVIKANNGGAEERSLDHFIVDPGFKPAGYVTNEVRTFNAPQDAVTYSNFVYLSAGPAQVTGQAAVEYWTHYLVADSGNHRLVELIDRYSVDPNGRVGSIITVPEPDPNVTPTAGQTLPSINVPQIGVLLWQSPANVSGKNFAYNSVTRLFLFQANGSGRYVYVCGIGNSQPTRADSGLDTANNLSLRQTSTGNGGVVIFDPASPSGIQVYNNFDMPDLTGTPFWSNSSASWTTTTAANTPATSRSISGLTSVSAKSLLNSSGNGEIAVMISEATGVYEFYVDPTVTNTNGDLGPPQWFINEAAYTELRSNTNVPAAAGGLATNPAQFHPSYARRLESGDVIIVNSYNGTLLGGLASPFKGEVLMLNGGIDTSSSNTSGEFELGKQNLGFYVRSIKFNFPSPQGVRGVVAPIFADRR